MNRILISGASISSGAGLQDEKNNPELFVTRLATEILQHKIEDVDNISIVGVDNKHIFLETALKLSTTYYSDALICWQTIPRINLNFGLETYQTGASIIAGTRNNHDINLVSNQTISKQKIKKIQQYFLRYYNLHWEILELIKYVNILKIIADTHNTRLHFINYSMPWDSNNYFCRINWTVPSDLDSFTQGILQTESRDDSEVLDLYSMIHDSYSQSGGINTDLWLNLHNPLRAMQVDNVSSTDFHPGLQSQEIFFDFLAPLLNINKLPR